MEWSEDSGRTDENHRKQSLPLWGLFTAVFYACLVCSLCGGQGALQIPQIQTKTNRTQYLYNEILEWGLMI